MNVFLVRLHARRRPLLIAAAVALLVVPARIAWRRWETADRANRLEARARNQAWLAAELDGAEPPDRGVSS